MNITIVNDVADSYPVDGLEIVIHVSLSVAFNTLLLLIFAYLHNVPLAKQCVLLQLYKEFVILLVLCMCLMNGALIGLYTYGYPMPWILATAITLCLRIGTIVLMLLANIIHLLKYRMSKEQMLDPPMPWGDDEKRGLLWIRLSCWGFSIGFAITMYFCGMQTVFYHLLTVQGYDESTMFIHYGLEIFLFATCTLLIVGERYYQKKNEGQAFDPVVTRRLQYLVLVIVIAFLFTNIGNLLIGVPIKSRQYRMWIRRKTLTIVLIVDIGIAIGTISKADQVRSFAIKVMKNIYDEAFFLNIYLVPLFLFILIHGCLCIIYHLFDI